MNPLYLIDASVYIFRAWFSVDDRLLDERGQPANAVFGYGNMLLDFLAGNDTLNAVAAFDQSLTTCFRNDFFPAYKANRPPAPEDLKRQIHVCRDLTRGLGLAALASERFEADDLIGTVAARFRHQGYAMRFVTTDKDYAQLLEPGDRLWDIGGRRNLDCDGVIHAFGVRADQVADLLALAGDSVDNIPGVPGIGPKTAAVLLRHLGSLDGVYRCLDQVPALPLRGGKRVQRLLEAHRDLAEVSLRLATIHREAPLDLPPGAPRRAAPDAELLVELPLPGRLRQRVNALLAPGG
ncbi:MAG: flap endonuclease, partial [Ectothiorhodospiraceae bacterium]|nr:flap endonuclease [Ectothiorhodospiraceae bacterium]